MKKKLGLWIDHRKAVIVAVTDKEEEITLINSKVEKHPRRAAPSLSNTHYDPLQVPADDSQEREFRRHLDIYYDEVIAFIREAEAILIFGPGEAKGELKHRIEKHKLGKHIVGVETVDKLTERQIVAKVREYFFTPHSATAAG